MSDLWFGLLLIYGVTAVVGAGGGLAWLVSPRFRKQIIGERRSPRD